MANLRQSTQLSNKLCMVCCRGFAERNVARNAAPSDDTSDKATATSAQAAAHKPGVSATLVRSGMIKAVFLSPNVLMEPYRCAFLLWFLVVFPFTNTASSSTRSQLGIYSFHLVCLPCQNNITDRMCRSNNRKDSHR